MEEGDDDKLLKERDEAAGPNQRDDYKFLKLSDAVTCLNQRVNLIGAVVEYGFPKRTKGTDYFISLKIVDESYSNQGIPVNFFAENVEKLPIVASPGDIVQLSHVVMKRHDGQVYASFDKKFSSFALYDGRYGKDFRPYLVSARFSSRELDKKLIGDVRTSLLSFQVNLDPNDVQLMSEMKEGQRHNLVGKILHTTKVAKDGMIIFLWDGTDAPKNNIETKLIDELSNPLPLQLEPEPLSRDVLCTFPTMGTVLRVFLDEGNKDLGLGAFRTGQWINFFNIVCEVHAGLWRGILMPFTKFRYVADKSRYVLSCLRSHKERVSSRMSKGPWSCISPSAVTEVGRPDVPFMSLMDIITHSQVTAKVKCIVRVVAILPFRVEDFRSRQGIYRVRLTLEDPTARIYSYLYDGDAEYFFKGRPTHDVLRKKMKKLLGIGEGDEINETEYTVRDPPWVGCCLKSYYIHKDEPWKSRHYRIFNTRLIG